ncbi:hypothetical protein LZL87_013946 [Fusarium oxysporum]|nr:hypothetical protein LZL87_013946 [Fusarium oxysporum]
MVKFASYFALLLTVASSALAVPSILEKRKVTCRDDLPASSLANVNLQQLSLIIRRGNTQITGLARGGNTATSSCKDVARGAGFIMDKCSRGDGKVRGANEAWANGNLLVDIRNVPQ